jgi:hypothetical protein
MLDTPYVLDLRESYFVLLGGVLPGSVRCAEAEDGHIAVIERQQGLKRLFHMKEHVDLLMTGLEKAGL